MTNADTRTTIDLGTGVDLRRIVVPMALEGDVDRGLTLATRLASHWSRPLLMVSVDLSTADAVTLERGGALERSRAAVVAAHPDIEVLDLVVGASDHPAAALAEALEPGDLVVIATTGGDAVHESFAQALAHEWGGPIMMVGPYARIDEIEGDVVLGVDGSALAERAAPLAMGLAAALDRHLWVVEVVPAATTAAVEALRARGEKVSEAAYVRDVVDRLDTPGGTWQVVHGDDPGESLAEFLLKRDAGFLVMATHGATGLPRAAFGSVCADAVRRARRPVVVMRPTLAPPEALPPS